jgi:hypothetical protein
MILNAMNDVGDRKHTFSSDHLARLSPLFAFKPSVYIMLKAISDVGERNALD